LNRTSQLEQPCVSLGLADDAKTSLGFPSNWNACHRSKPKATPNFKHQEEFCLGGMYAACPLYLSSQEMPLPKDLQISGHSSELTREKYRANPLIVPMILIIGLGLVWGLFRNRSLPSDLEPAAQTGGGSAAASANAVTIPAHNVRLTPSLTPFAPLIIFGAKGSPTQPPTIAPTIPPTSISSKHQLEVLIGTDLQFMIHKVLKTETLIQIAAKYNTSVAAIESINFLLPNPGYSGTLIIIPVGFDDVTKLPGFVVFQVMASDRGISIENLAKRLKVNPLDLRYYNGWTSVGDRPLVGDYLLVPRLRPLK